MCHALSCTIRVRLQRAIRACETGRAMQVVALHSRGVRKQSADTNGIAKTSTVPADGKYEANLGVRISAIVKVLEAVPELKVWLQAPC